MTTRRLLKAAEAIREVVASAIVTEIRDPRVQGVTVIGVKVSPDMREAKIKVSVMGDEKRENLTLRGLQNSAGFLQQRIAQRIDTRHTPRLTFEIDRGVQNSMVVNEILAQIRREKAGDISPVAAPGELPVDCPHDETSSTGKPDDGLSHDDSGAPT